MKHGFQIYFELLEQARGEDTSLPALQRKWLTTSVRSYAHHTGRVPLVFDFIKWNGKGKIPGPASWRHPWAGSCRGLVRKGRRRPAGGKAQCWGLLGGRWGGGEEGRPPLSIGFSKGGPRAHVGKRVLFRQTREEKRQFPELQPGWEEKSPAFSQCEHSARAPRTHTSGTWGTLYTRQLTTLSAFI